MPFDIIRIRRDTLANWTSVNPTLALGEISYDLTNDQIRVGDGTSAWLDLPVIGNAAIANGDKGDIVVTDSGATWTLDPSIVTTINNKLDQGPLDGGTASTGDQVFQVRRDTTVGWVTSGTILGNGEMGYDSTLVEIRVGNGVDVWEDLDPIGINKAGSTQLVMLADVDYPTSSPAEGEVLTFDSGTDNWVNRPIPAVSLGLDDITNVVLTSPSNTQILQFNGTNWVNAPAPVSTGGTLTSGSKNHINVINTASDWQINNNVITQDMLNLTMPTNPEDAATKGYADSIVGLAVAANVTEELDQANGLAVLNSSRLVATNRLGTGTAGSSNFLRGDGQWSIPTVLPSTISQGSATIGEVLTWSDDLTSWAPVPITAGDGISFTYDDLTPEHSISLDKTRNLSLLITKATPDLVNTRNLGATDRGDWSEAKFGFATITYPGGGIANCTLNTDTMTTEVTRLWLRNELHDSVGGAPPTQDITLNDFIQVWTGRISTAMDPVASVIVGYSRTHDSTDERGSLERVVGFIANAATNTWHAAVYKRPSNSVSSAVGNCFYSVDTKASITTTHTLGVVIQNGAKKALFYVDGILVGVCNSPLFWDTAATKKLFSGLHMRYLGGVANLQTVAVTLETTQLIERKYTVDGVVTTQFESVFPTQSLQLSSLGSEGADPDVNNIIKFNTKGQWESGRILPEDIDQAGATDGQVLKWSLSSGKWIPAADDSGGGGGGVTDHGALTGLADDDHTQYHNDARGDARYSQLGHAHDLASLTDVSFPTSPVSQHVLAFNVSTGQWENTDKDTWLAGHNQPLNTIFPASIQQVSGRLVWWNNDSGQTRTVTLGGTGLASVSHDNTANTITVDVPTSHSHTLSNITDAGTMAAQNASSVAITGGTLQGTTVTTGTYSSPSNQAVMKQVRNNTGATIAKGKVVRITGSLGDNLTVALADATDESTSSSTIGITSESISDGADGFIITQGVLTNLTGIDTPLVNGDLLWLSETAGEFTRTRPTAPAHGVVVGWVMSTSTGSAGRIYVKIDNGYELNELHNVSIPSTPADKDLLAWDNTAGVWKNMTKATAGVAASTHTHVMTDITDSSLFGRSLLDDADASAARTTLGLGALAVKSTIATADIDASAVTGLKIANNTINFSNKMQAPNTVLGFFVGNATDGTSWNLTSFNTSEFELTSDIHILSINGSKLANASVAIGKINATGTPSSTTFLRGDGQWETPAGSGGAPVGATYIVQTSDGTLTNEQALGSLATGILKNTTGTGVLSIATGSDLPSHTHAQSDITNLVTDLAGKASTSHTHSAADITSGSLALARIAQGGATSGQVLKWNNISAVWEPGTDNTGGSAAPGGSDRQVQFNDSNLVIAGASQVNIEADGNLKLIKPGSAPATPAANSMVIYPVSYAGREQLGFKDENGFVSNLQVCLAKNKIRVYSASNANAVAGVFGFPAFTAVGTLTARNFATTSLLTTITRHAYVSAASTANAWAQMRSPNSGLFCWRGNASGLGGFYCLFRFAISDATLNTGGEVFVGLSTTLTAMANGTAFSVETLADTVGLYAIDGATNYSIGCNDNTGNATLTSLGASFPVNNTDFYELILFAKPNDSSIFYEVTNISTGANTSGTLTTDLPRNTVGLGVQIIRGNNASTSSAPAFDISQIYAETQF